VAYIVNVDGKEFKVAIRRQDGSFEFFLNDKKVDVEIAHENDAQMTLVINDRPFTIVVESDDQVLVNGQTYMVDVVDEQIRRFVKAGPDQSHKTDLAVKAVMPGLVIDVNVSEGDQVKSGDGLLIIEAMKMQNEIKAPRDGTLKKISVTRGQTVNTGDTLVVIE
jgi:biotin carboxyl carrier protein